ncbi:unnamed protein product [Caenorhabditis angaria]|uniref:Serpentine Receptor, class H n=1 Tax=Caenorhabditis angaria TaxID=860376 RepID=A0A9P1N9L2_9PELO|nr:unnamed protein product [Caenorhabditis angaria]
MKNTKTVLLHLHFCTFLLDIIVDFLVTPYIYLPTSAVTLCGILYEYLNLPFKPLCYFGQLSLYLMAMSMVRLFQTRHSIIATIKYKMNKKLTLLIYYTYMYLFGIITMMLYFFDETPTKTAKQYFLQIYPCPPIEYFDDRTLVITTDIFAAVFCMSVATFHVVAHGSYFAIVGAYHLLKVPSRNLSQRTKKLQLTFLYNVSIQVAIPFTAIFIPISIFGMMLFLSTYSQIMNNVIMLTISFHGLLSNISLIFLHKPYRDFTFGLVLRKKSKIEKNLSSVSTIVIVENQASRISFR